MFVNAYLKQVFDNKTSRMPSHQVQVLRTILQLNDVLTGTERIINTPLPLAYSIVIGQITWAYILLLPFQLFSKLGWGTIPGTLFIAYVILGVAEIGREIENPFGYDKNDLPLDAFCDHIRRDIDILMSRAPPDFSSIVNSGDNKLLSPLSGQLGGDAWADRSTQEIRAALAGKPRLGY
jgi:putative membrane protein